MNLTDTFLYVCLMYLFVLSHFPESRQVEVGVVVLDVLEVEMRQLEAFQQRLHVSVLQRSVHSLQRKHR